MSPLVILRLVAALVVAGVIGLLVGRYTTTPMVVTQTVEVERIKTVTVKGEDKVVVRRVVVVAQPDGSSTTTTDEREATKTDERTATTEKTDRSVITKPVEKDWRVSALVGTDLALTHPPSTIYYGALVERRIAGPFSAGVFALGGKAGVVAGVSVGVVW